MLWASDWILRGTELSNEELTVLWAFSLDTKRHPEPSNEERTGFSDLLVSRFGS